MIIQFTIGNFKTFKDKATLDMRAASLSELKDTHVFPDNKEQLLKSVGIFGKNAAGKSKLIEGLKFMRDFVIESSKESQSNESIDDVDPFRLNTATIDKPSFFEIEFYLNEIQYRYGFEVTKERVEKEWLFEKKKTKEYPLFLRLQDEFQIDEKRFKEGKTRKEFTRSNALFLSLSAQLNGKLSQEIITWFDNIIFTYTVCGRSGVAREKTEELLESSEHKAKILAFIKKADVDIEDIELVRFDKIKSSETGEEVESDYHESFVKTYHKLYDEKNDFIEHTEFYLDDDESDGTVRLFSLTGHIIDSLLNGGVIVSDELNSRLHTLLVQAILMEFNSKKNSKAQLIFTAHDTNLKNKKLLRRDQIYFVEKDRFGASQLYSLADFKPRKDHNYEKQYLEGRYGAIPFIDTSINPLEASTNGKKEKQKTET